MRFFITSDSYWEAKVESVIDAIDETGYKQFFSEQNYGSSLEGITVVLMCQDPNLELKQRIRYSKKEKKIYLDIMLDLNQILSLDQKSKKRIIAQKLISEIPPIISKYKLDDFNLDKFKNDLQIRISKIL